VRLSLIWPIECEVEGRVYVGTYELRKDLLKVTLADSIRCATPGARPDFMAKIMLRQLVEEVKRKARIGAQA
jgi:hypothetical protein